MDEKKAREVAEKHLLNDNMIEKYTVHNMKKK